MDITLNDGNVMRGCAIVFRAIDFCIVLSGGHFYFVERSFVSDESLIRKMYVHERRPQ